ncbi:hypothetical protein K461DRAFT_221895 [Myriangium duriaei CBS 260.36]|uniref:STB6-like N-terminal domain-containing protein n=1 Tax=Myriangium duriaei CBS 260.36 TaxID=1168546 RepID=A0A9P4J555_9PEZI|nr:hypothetical protein K461DRAFT_221895 [Myriangium duriaei CBS 260.36]
MSAAGRTSRSWSRTRTPGGGTSRRNSYEKSQVGDAHNKGFQRFILTDPIAFRYLENDSCVTVLEPRREMSAYQTYIVEQWATSRTHPTFTITTYTGDVSDKIVASVLGIPKDETVWSQRLRIYFKALNHFHARRRDTPDGALMVTSLPGFPSSLTVIQVPDGDVSKHYADFFVNEDLKRLGCSGRVGLTLAHPNNATVAKYHQLYRTSDKNPLYSSVIELVRMCQIALHIFNVLDTEYVDGLLCDVTEHAIQKWWASFGTDVYNIEPHDGILGPTTVAALLGLFLGARNRLHALSVPVPKDPFDLLAMKRGIWHFQKSQRLHRNRRLDELTLRKLHHMTEKATHTEGVWRVPKAVKTTVAELSGKGEEMAAEGTSRKNKAGIADIETTDIDNFEQLVSGERCKWLWHAKPLKRTNTAAHGEASLDGLLSPKGAPTEDLAFGKKQRTSDGVPRRSLEEPHTASTKSPRRSLEEPNPQKSVSHRGTAAKKVHGVIDDGKAGIDRLIGAVHPQKRPTEPVQSGQQQHQQQPRGSPESPKRPANIRSHTSPVSSAVSPLRIATSALRNELSSAEIDDEIQLPSPVHKRAESQTRIASRDLQTALNTPQRRKSPVPDIAQPSDLSKSDDANRATDYHGINLDESLPIPQNIEQNIPSILRRTKSFDVVYLQDEAPNSLNQRRLSFSLAESSMFILERSSWPEDYLQDEGEELEYIRQKFHAENLKRIRVAIKELSQNEAVRTAQQMEKLEEQVQQATLDQEMLRGYHESPAQTAQNLKEMAEMAIHDEQEIIEEGRRELETLTAKLDYEIANLRSKIEDVEIGVDEFKKAVHDTEMRVEEVERETFGRVGWTCVMS